jgi:hypothetical protein
LNFTKENPLELRDRYFTKSYKNPNKWSFAIVDIDLKFLVLFPEKSVFLIEKV